MYVRLQCQHAVLDRQRGRTLLRTRRQFINLEQENNCKTNKAALVQAQTAQWQQKRWHDVCRTSINQLAAKASIRSSVGISQRELGGGGQELGTESGEIETPKASRRGKCGGGVFLQGFAGKRNLPTRPINFNSLPDPTRPACIPVTCAVRRSVAKGGRTGRTTPRR